MKLTKDQILIKDYNDIINVLSEMDSNNATFLYFNELYIDIPINKLKLFTEYINAPIKALNARQEIEINSYTFPYEPISSAEAAWDDMYTFRVYFDAYSDETYIELLDEEYNVLLSCKLFDHYLTYKLEGYGESMDQDTFVTYTSIMVDLVSYITTGNIAEGIEEYLN